MSLYFLRNVLMSQVLLTFPWKENNFYNKIFSFNYSAVYFRPADGDGRNEAMYGKQKRLAGSTTCLSAHYKHTIQVVENASSQVNFFKLNIELLHSSNYFLSIYFMLTGVSSIRK